jgi:hypothetical protein
LARLLIPKNTKSSGLMRVKCSRAACKKTLTAEQVTVATSRGLIVGEDPMYCGATCRVAEKNRRAKEKRKGAKDS